MTRLFLHEKKKLYLYVKSNPSFKFLDKIVDMTFEKDRITFTAPSYSKDKTTSIDFLLDDSRF